VSESQLEVKIDEEENQMNKLWLGICLLHLTSLASLPCSLTLKVCPVLWAKGFPSSHAGAIPTIKRQRVCEEVGKPFVFPKDSPSA